MGWRVSNRELRWRAGGGWGTTHTMTGTNLYSRSGWWSSDANAHSSLYVDRPCPSARFPSSPGWNTTSSESALNLDAAARRPCRPSKACEKRMSTSGSAHPPFGTPGTRVSSPEVFRVAPGKLTLKQLPFCLRNCRATRLSPLQRMPAMWRAKPESPNCLTCYAGAARGRSS